MEIWCYEHKGVIVEIIEWRNRFLGMLSSHWFSQKYWPPIGSTPTWQKSECGKYKYSPPSLRSGGANNQVLKAYFKKKKEYWPYSWGLNSIEKSTIISPPRAKRGGAILVFTTLTFLSSGYATNRKPAFLGEPMRIQHFQKIISPLTTHRLHRGC